MSTNEKPRRTRDRQASENRLLEAALSVLRRDGALAGLNLADVADEAGVNRGLIYQYFGSRQELLRAAIVKFGWEHDGTASFFARFQDLPFVERRLAVFRDSQQHSDRSKLLALLIADNDQSISVMPALARTRELLERDVATGELDPDVDPVMAHVLSAVVYLGYDIFREQLARELDVPLTELDDRAERTLRRMLEALKPGAGDRATDPA